MGSIIRKRILYSVILLIFFNVNIQSVLAQTDYCPGFSIEREVQFDVLTEGITTPPAIAWYYFYVEEGDFIRFDLVGSTAMVFKLVPDDMPAFWTDADTLYRTSLTTTPVSTGVAIPEEGYYCFYIDTEGANYTQAPFGFRVSNLQEDENGMLVGLDGLNSYGLNEAGHRYYRQKNFTLAAYYYDSSLTMSPNDSIVMSNLGEALLFSGRFDAAEEQLNASYAINPDNIRARSRSGYLGLLRGDYDLAYEAYSDLVTEDESYYYWRGIAEIGRGNFTQAITNLRHQTDEFSYLWQAYLALTTDATSEYENYLENTYDLAESGSIRELRLFALHALIEERFEEAETFYMEVLEDSDLLYDRASDLIYIRLLVSQNPDVYADFLDWFANQLSIE